MATKPKQEEVDKPTNLDLDKAQSIVHQLIKANKPWVKEMADK